MNTKDKSEFKCPWCGSNFQTATKLTQHAREHYRETLKISIRT